MWFEEAARLLGIPLHYHSPGEHHGPCPECGGKDRFIVWPSGRAWCRQCRLTVLWLEGKDAERAAESSRAGKESRRREAAWWVLVEGEVWIRYHRSCLRSERAMAEWEKSGIGRGEIEKWGLGWADPCPVYSKSPSLVIPVFGGGRLLDIRHRLVNPGDEGGKYRGHFPGRRPQLFNADVARMGPVVVVEGEKKVIVLDEMGIRAVGLAGVGQSTDRLVALAKVRPFSTIVALDPGAEEQARRVASDMLAAGCKVWMADFPMKPDDFLIEFGIGLTREVLHQARRCRGNGRG